jgi:hypothetical protein
MSVPRNVKKQPITWTSNLSQPILVTDWRNIEITVVGTGDVSVLASKDKTIDPIDFSSPSTITNSYATIALYDETVTSSNFVTTLTVSASTKIAEIDSNLLTWIAVSRSADTVDAFITYSDNQ